MKVLVKHCLLKKNKIYSFKDAKASIQKLNLVLSGSFGNESIDFEAKGQQLDIQSFLSLLPEKINEKKSEEKN